MKSDKDLRQFVCPACDYTIYNRRNPECEGCGVLLPEHLLYSDEQLETKARESALQQRRRESQLSLKEQLRQSSINGWFDE